MRTICTMFLIIFGCLQSLDAEDGFHNYVSIKNGLFLSVTDEENSGTLMDLLHDSSLDSKRPLLILAYNDSLKGDRLWTLNNNYLFSFQLYDSKSNRIIKRSLGISNSFVPPKTI